MNTLIVGIGSIIGGLVLLIIGAVTWMVALTIKDGETPR